MIQQADGHWGCAACGAWGGHSLGVFSALIVNGPWGRTVIGFYLCWVRAMINWYHPWVYVHAHINAHVHTRACAKTRREPPRRACVAVRLSGELSIELIPGGRKLLCRATDRQEEKKRRHIAVHLECHSDEPEWWYFTQFFFSFGFRIEFRSRNNWRHLLYTKRACKSV